MEKYSRKDLKEQYKTRTVIGGVYCLKCNENGRMWIKSTKNMEGNINRFEFSVSTNLCPEPGMSVDWNQYGAKVFDFVILEELKKGETQTEREYANDINLLLELWLEKQQIEEQQIKEQ